MAIIYVLCDYDVYFVCVIFYFLYIFRILYIEDVLPFHQKNRNDNFCVENFKFSLCFLLVLSMFT